jgi:predicted nuclease of predicted toxin-antitoxin system
MKLLLDAHLSARVAEALRAKGYDVLCVVDVGLEKALDRPIWEWAIAEGRVVVSYDVGDFPSLFDDLFHEGIEHPGLVVISTKTIGQGDFGSQIRSLEHLLASDQDLTSQMIFLNPV